MQWNSDLIVKQGQQMFQHTDLIASLARNLGELKSVVDNNEADACQKAAPDRKSRTKKK